MAAEGLCLLPACFGNQKPNRAEAGAAPLLGAGSEARWMLWDLFSQMWGDWGSSLRGTECGGSV